MTGTLVADGGGGNASSSSSMLVGGRRPTVLGLADNGGGDGGGGIANWLVGLLNCDGGEWLGVSLAGVGLVVNGRGGGADWPGMLLTGVCFFAGPAAESAAPLYDKHAVYITSVLKFSYI